MQAQRWSRQGICSAGRNPWKIAAREEVREEPRKTGLYRVRTRRTVDVKQKGQKIINLSHNFPQVFRPFFFYTDTFSHPRKAHDVYDTERAAFIVFFLTGVDSNILLSYLISKSP